jgi:hypothetical protein
MVILDDQTTSNLCPYSIVISLYFITSEVPGGWEENRRQESDSASLRVPGGNLRPAEKHGIEHHLPRAARQPREETNGRSEGADPGP